MKNFILTLITVLSMLSLTSCETYAQAAVYDDGFVYEYSYNNYPVRYVDGVAYYYCLYNNIWSWIILDRIYYDRIIHHPRPIRYIRPHFHYNNRHRIHARRPPQRPDRISPQARPDRRSDISRQGNHSSGGGFGNRTGGIHSNNSVRRH